MLHPQLYVKITIFLLLYLDMDIPGNITKAAKGEEIGTIVRGE